MVRIPLPSHLEDPDATRLPGQDEMHLEPQQIKCSADPCPKASRLPLVQVRHEGEWSRILQPWFGRQHMWVFCGAHIRKASGSSGSLNFCFIFSVVSDQFSLSLLTYQGNHSFKMQLTKLISLGGLLGLAQGEWKSSGFSSPQDVHFPHCILLLCLCSWCKTLLLSRTRV